MIQHKATSIWAGHKAALEELVTESKQGKNVLLYCESSAEINRVSEIIRDINKEIPPRFKLLLGFVHQGFVINSLRTIIISHHELFGQYTLRQRRRPTRATTPIESLGDLREIVGEFVWLPDDLAVFRQHIRLRQRLKPKLQLQLQQ